jgi:hypothetical protein
MHVTDRRRGFQRKDNWQRHMRAEHGVSEKELEDIEKAGIPTARKIGTGWVEVPETIGKGKLLEEAATEK